MFQNDHSQFRKNKRNHLHTAVALTACFLVLLSSAACSSKTDAKSSSKKASASSSASKPVSSAVTSSPSSKAPQKATTVAAKPKSKILAVKNIQQKPELQSGCEITAANIVLNYLGYNASKTDLLKYLPNSNDFKTVSGKQYGPNPWKTFVGNPSANQYGCYAPVLANAVNEYILNTKGKHTAYDMTGTTVDDLYGYIDKGIPSIVWVTEGMQEPAFGDTWYLNDTGSQYQWIVKEHCMVLIGYTDKQAVFSDPLDGRGTVSYDKTLFAERYQALFSQAVAIG